MWKKIKKFPYYSANEFGEIKVDNYIKVDKIGRKTNVKEKILKQYKDKDGYSRVMLCIGIEKPKNIPVHRLVAETFIPNPNNLPCVNHKDENKRNNHISNLEWCTIQYNNNYGKRNKKMKETLINKYGKKIIAIKKEKKYFFNSVGEASRTLGVDKSNIFSCLKGKLNSINGYKFITEV